MTEDNKIETQSGGADGELNINASLLQHLVDVEQWIRRENPGRELSPDQALEGVVDLFKSGADPWTENTRRLILKEKDIFLKHPTTQTFLARQRTRLIG